jgi:hypothetical protein
MSLISLLAKVGTVGAVAAISYGTIEDVVRGTLDSVSVNAAWSDMRMIHGKMMEFYSTNNRYPTTEVEMVNFFKNEFDTGLEDVFTDPWKKNYNFFVPKYEIHSNGPDTTPRTKDDLGIDYPNNVRKPF